MCPHCQLIMQKNAIYTDLAIEITAIFLYNDDGVCAWVDHRKVHLMQKLTRYSEEELPMVPIVHEKPRLPIENTGEEHLACVVLVDTSLSMSGYEQELKDAIAAMKKAIMDDDIARGKVEICLITFDDDVKEESPFSAITRMEIPNISCGGMTSTHAAVQFALRRVAERTAEYELRKVTHKQPWIWLLTDGGSNDADNGSFEELLQAQRDAKCTFFGVAIGEGANETELGGMHKKGMVLRIGRDNLGKAFEFISQNASGVSAHKSGEKIKVPVPSEMEVQFIEIPT